MSSPTVTQAPQRSFEALRHPGYRAFFLSLASAMMADSIEHVISYWVIFRKFHSPALGGFAIIAHWLPFLTLSVHAGALADRFDPRRIIQLGMLLFMSVSIAWGVLFITDTLQMWHACVLLLLHGLAGVLWSPASQLLLHDIVEPHQLQSAVRLNATSRQLGLLLGPAIGGIILVVLGPSKGILFNALLYLPTLLWLWRAPYGPRFRKGQAAPARPIRGFGDVVSTIREVAAHRVIALMTLLAGAASFLVGNAYGAQMPGFAEDLGRGAADLSYSVLLGADAAGALFGGILLESRGLLRPDPRTALLLAMVWCCMLVGFACTSIYPLALLLLFIAGFVELSFNSMAQTLVQLHAPAQIRGRVIGVYSMSALGMRTFSGFSIGLLGSWLGIHWSLALSAAALFVVLGLLAFADGHGLRLHRGGKG
jgi:MFS family permease